MAVGYGLGGSLRNLERLDLRLAWLVILALSVQLVIFSPLGTRLGDDLIIGVHLASYGMLIAFVLVNVRQAGIAVVGAGIALNTLAIAANGGYMPASQRALEAAGLGREAAVHNNSAVAEAGARLLALGDVFAVPSWVPLFANVFSVGDVLIAAGVAMLLATAMKPALRAQAVQ